MANQWFRLYSEFADDPKVQMMPEAMQRRLVMLFCSRCKDETLHETQRAFHWRISVQELAETKAVFIQNGFIDEDWNLVNWNRRQFLSDSSTDRVRKHRQALKQDETLHETTRNVTVTPVTVSVTAPEQNRTESETEQKPSPKPRKRVSEGRKKKELLARPTKTDFDRARHREFKTAIFEYWQTKNQIDCPWGQPEGMQLEMWLKANPTVVIGEFKAMLRNRYRSNVVHSQRPSKWIFDITSFANGPLDRYNKPPQEDATNGRHGPNNGGGATARVKRGLDALGEALAKRGLEEFRPGAGGGDSALAVAGNGGIVGSVPDGPRTAGESLFDQGGHNGARGVENPSRAEILPPAR